MKVYLVAMILSVATLAGAQDVVKPIPPEPNARQELSRADRAQLQAGADKLGKQLDELSRDLQAKPALLALLPDIRIYHNAVRYPLTYHEVIDPRAARHCLCARRPSRASHMAKNPLG